ANQQGQLGIDSNELSVSTPAPVQSNATWKSVHSGRLHACAISTDDNLYCWGNNEFGQLGNDSTTHTRLPTRIGTDSDWQSAAGGHNSTCAIRNNTFYCWGSNANAVLGNSQNDTRYTAPTPVTEETNW